ncbi:chemotaxis protein CheB [Coleofasciculus sp. FACHB-1120]|uniref:chemotaxis protein CheB n=1 Tax=Coleofasciculus sp. FACHB-1120 TaxID=2692783 RepID=UPI00168690E5|nr:chemotaxis protein CheB [Coleofasciculus sp. FACHB-1120]MBD2743374.1 chemotaxis protein CheB [Coleofasciculus sp. FACHB-1120]
MKQKLNKRNNALILSGNGLIQGQLPATVPLAESEESGESAGGNGNSRSPFKVVVLAVSEGGLIALSHILPAFPPDFPAAIIVVQKPDTQSGSSLITDALNRPTTLPLKQAQEGEPLKPGMVYVAPANQHLLVTSEGTFCLSGAVLVDFARPSADLLLQSLAASFKERAIAVILSGSGGDGVSGVQAIKKMGGLAIAQNESTSEFFEMPRAAIEKGKVDFVLPLDEIGSTLVNLVVSSVLT